MMNNIEVLKYALRTLADINDEEFELSAPHWQEKEYKKGEYYNEYKNICKYMGFIIDGVFRSYYVDAKSGEEKNVFFFSRNQVVVSYKSFISQEPCNYYTQSMTESKILYIHIDQLTALYKRSHKWERFGRLIAELAFTVSMSRTESFLFLSPEERYLDLIKQHPDIFNNVPLYHISSYLGIQGPSLSRIRKRIMHQ